jgi:hypothetical protein
MEENQAQQHPGDAIEQGWPSGGFRHGSFRVAAILLS